MRNEEKKIEANSNIYFAFSKTKWTKITTLNDHHDLQNKKHWNFNDFLPHPTWRKNCVHVQPNANLYCDLESYFCWQHINNNKMPCKLNLDHIHIIQLWSPLTTLCVLLSCRPFSRRARIWRSQPLTTNCTPFLWQCYFTILSNRKKLHFPFFFI
jgi:hypothetical protein